MDMTGTGAFILIIIFTCINLSVLHKFVFRIYFSGTAIFREIFYAFLLAFVEVGIIVKVFAGVLGVVWTIIKFLLKLVLVLAIIAAIGFVLFKIIPKIVPKVQPIVNKLIVLINKKMHIFSAKYKGTEENTHKGNNDMENELNKDNTFGNAGVFCNNCGSQLLEGALFCQKCGARVYNKNCTQIDSPVRYVGFENGYSYGQDNKSGK